SVNNKDVKNLKEFKEEISYLQPGETVKYTFKRGKNIYETEVKTIIFSWKDWINIFGVGFIFIIFYVVLLLLVAFSENKDKKRESLTFLSLFILSFSSTVLG